MSKKFSFIFSLLVFAILFSFIGCTDLLAPKAQTDINLKIDLSKIIKSSRNEGGSQGASSLGDNPTIKVAIYDAKDYDKATNSTENLTLITQAQASVGGDGIARVKLSDIPVGIDAIVFAELSFTNENSTQVVYAGNSGVFKVKASDNKVSLVLKKVNNDSEPPIDDTGSGDTYVVEDFILYTKDNGDETEVDSNEYATLTNETEYTKVTIKSPDNSDSVWTYFVKPENNTRFTEDGNYKVSVDLKTKSDATTVVGIAAARADYFFTVNDTWTPCEFETGYVKGSTDHDFTIGLGLSSEIQIKNLKIEKLSEIDTTEPSLVFDISRHAIETYLGKDDRPEKIIDVSKIEGNAGYSITINTPMCRHSTGTDDSYIQDVKLHLRSYATETTGANRVSFRVDNLGAKSFYTSVMADTANEKSTAWNNGTQQITSGALGSYKIDFPNYVQNDELNVGVITSSNEAITEPINLKISEFAVTVPNASVSPFANKIFAIQVGETWTQEKSVEVTIPVNDYKEFDVGMFNDWDYSNDMPSSFDDVTRFFYTGDTNIKDDLIYSVNNDNPNDPIFTITNESVEDKIVKISLNENYEVVIEEVTGTTITSWDNLKSQIDGLNNSNTTTEIVITDDLTATETITVSKPVKITALKDVTISRGQNFKGKFFVVDGTDNESDKGSLELGSNDYTITVDGGKDNNITATDPLIWAYSESKSLTLTNCILQNNTNNNSNPDYAKGAAVKVESNFTMNNSFIKNCHSSEGGAVYIFARGSFTMNGGSITECSATNDGGAVYITEGGTFTMNDYAIISDCTATLSGGGVWMDGGSSFTMSGSANIKSCNALGNEGGGVFITSNGNPCSFTMNGFATITGCSAEKDGGGVSYGCGASEEYNFTMQGNASITSCSATLSGGGVYLYGNLVMNGGTISDNKASNGAGVYVRDDSSSFTMNGGTISDNNATGYGGGVYLLDSTSSFTMTNGTISNNWVNNENKGASIYCTGGTVYLPDGSTVTSNGMFTKNIINGVIQDVTTGGGGNATQSISTFSDLRSAITDANNSSSSYTLDNPCVIYIGDSFSTDGDTASTLTISTHVKLVANKADGCIITKTSVYAGTNIFIVSPGASLTLGDETATGILTIDGAGSSVQSTKSLINVSGTLVLNEKSVLQNSYIENSTHGGAVYSSGGTIKVHGGVVQNNTIIVKSKYGGGIYLKNGTFEMTSGKFQENSGSVSSGYMYGGALYFDSCTVNITGGTFINNSVLDSTDCYGGAIYISNSGNTSTPAKISNCTFNSNSAYQRGGAIYIGGTTCININNCTFNDNSVTNSTVEGGAIYVANTSGGPVTISECNFENNTASSSENTIYNGSSSSANISVTVDGTAVANSSVWNPSASGGGIDGSIQSLSDLSSYYDSTNECYSLTSGTYIFGKNLQLDKPLYILSGNDVTICSDTAVTITSSFSDDNLVYIDRQDEENYGTLTLGSGDGVLTLKHENSTYPTIASYGELKLENNCAITGSNYCAINIYNGNFYMNGGEIYGNKYSGSNIQSSAVNLLFTYDSIDSYSAEFYGGKIYNNETTTSGGAIAYTGDAMPYIELTGIEIFNNKALNTGGGIYSNTANLYVNLPSKIYDNYVNGTNQGASIFVTEYEGFFYLDDVDTYDIPYTQDIGL